MAYAPYHVVDIFSSPDLMQVLNTVESFVSKISSSSSRAFTKFPQWRKEQATIKQKNIVKRYFENVIKDDDKYDAMKPFVDVYVDNMTKGEASSLLFATKLAPKYPIKRILKLLSWRNSEQKQRKIG